MPTGKFLAIFWISSRGTSGNVFQENDFKIPLMARYRTNLKQPDIFDEPFFGNTFQNSKDSGMETLGRWLAEVKSGSLFPGHISSSRQFCQVQRILYQVRHQDLNLKLINPAPLSPVSSKHMIHWYLRIPFLSLTGLPFTISCPGNPDLVMVPYPGSYLSMIRMIIRQL